MPAFINAEITAEDITNAMNEDCEFAKEVWCELAEKLNMGLLKDNACDVLCETPNLAQNIAREFDAFAKALLGWVVVTGSDLNCET